MVSMIAYTNIYILFLKDEIVVVSYKL